MNASLQPVVQVAIVGAGPYGLSLAAHLRQAGVPFRIFGRPMQSWATQMPAAMKLKSDGFASNLSAGAAHFTLEDFCTLTGREYHATQLPVPLEDFIAYGREFARRLVPTLEQREVVSIDATPEGFQITLEGGETLLARHVILATGITAFPHLPENLRHLPANLLTHTTDHTTFAEFKDRDITVLGRGASSLDAAALLHEAGANVTLISRSPNVHVPPPRTGRPRSLFQRILHPASPLGSSLRSWLACTVPGAFHALPAALRRLIFYKHLGPAGGATLRERVQGKFPVLLGWTIASAELIEAPNTTDRRIKLTLTNAEGDTREHITSHIIAGTGFRVDMNRYRFLNDAVRAGIDCRRDGSPVLSSKFETSVKGLSMIGPVAHSSFGPLLRFAAGSQYAATQVTKQLVRSLAKHRTNEVPSFAPLPASSSVK